MTIRSLAQLRNVPRPPWVWEGFIAPKNFTLFSAYPKVGKTTMLFHMLAALSANELFLDRQTRAVPTLYVSEEADTLLAERADRCGFLDSWNIGWITPEPGLTWEKIIHYIKRYVYLYGEPLIIIDTLSRFWSAESENDASQVNHAINPVLEVIRNSQASLFGIHHNRKQGGGGGIGVRGSTALTGGVDVIMELERTSGYDRSNIRRLRCESRFGETPTAIQMRLEDGHYIVEDAEAIEMETILVTLLQTMAGVTINDITTLLDEPETTIRRVINGMVTRGVVARTGQGTSRSPFLYTLNVLTE